jgi:hypothetical protein
MWFKKHYSLIFSLEFSELKQYLKKRKRGSKGDDEIKPRWEADYELLENEGLFQEYLEMGKSCTITRNEGISICRNVRDRSTSYNTYTSITYAGIQLLKPLYLTV